LIVLYLTTLSKTKQHLLIDEANKIKGWAFTFLEMMKIGLIRVDKNSQGSGKGSLLMEELKRIKIV
jgi:hypothetical protein